MGFGSGRPASGLARPSWVGKNWESDDSHWIRYFSIDKLYQFEMGWSKTMQCPNPHCWPFCIQKQWDRLEGVCSAGLHRSELSCLGLRPNWRHLHSERVDCPSARHVNVLASIGCVTACGNRSFVGGMGSYMHVHVQMCRYIHTHTHQYGSKLATTAVAVRCDGFEPTICYLWAIFAGVHFGIRPTTGRHITL